MSLDDAVPPTAADLTLREVTRENLRDILRLKVAPDQEHFVAPNAVSIAQAHFYPEVAWFRAIYADETPIGFAMFEQNPAERQYYLWRFMIDARAQGRGFGRRALELLIAHVKAAGATEMTLSCVPDPGSPGPFYERLGFSYTGAEEEGELVMRLAW